MTWRAHDLLDKDPALLLRHFRLRGVGADAQEGLLGWLEGRYHLRLRNSIPTALEMLEIQCQGQRWVTLIDDEAKQFVRYGRHANAFEFLLHDLEHAHKFFGDSKSHLGQVRFFQFLRANLPCFKPLLSDADFLKAFEYLISDMNAHPMHLMKYLKAIVFTTFAKDETQTTAFFARIFEEWPADVREAAFRINTPWLESRADHEILTDYFAGAV